MKTLKNILTLLIIIFLIFLGTTLFAQNVGIGTATPDPSAKLEINSNNSGLLIPRLTTAQRDAIAGPAHGLMIINTDNFCLEIYDTTSAQWFTISCPKACSPTCTPTITGPASPCANSTATYTASGCSGVQYQWSVPTGWTINSGQGTNSITVTTGTTGGNIGVILFLFNNVPLQKVLYLLQ